MVRSFALQLKSLFENKLKSFPSYNLSSWYNHNISETAIPPRERRWSVWESIRTMRSGQCRKSQPKLPQTTWASLPWWWPWHEKQRASNQLCHQKENRCSESRSYNIILERLIAYHHGKNACRIHAYVSAMEKAYSEQALSAWASWARAKADWYDPAIAKKKTNFLAGGSMKRIKRTKVPGTRDAGGKAKGYSPSESNNIAVHLSISLNNYSKYIINNSWKR